MEGVVAHMAALLPLGRRRLDDDVRATKNKKCYSVRPCDVRGGLRLLSSLQTSTFSTLNGQPPPPPPPLVQRSTGRLQRWYRGRSLVSCVLSGELNVLCHTAAVSRSTKHSTHEMVDESWAA